MGPNPKRGKPQNEKVCWGVRRVLGSIRDFCFGSLRVRCKKTFENRFTVSRSKIDFKKCWLKQK